mmetsp:Transcript_43883/g.135607  ORF Transcript_43883/g.135607 Transcript_43883/m.135607 type:complete len:226 (+) Transcript_43883:375-1052(+)
MGLLVPAEGETRQRRAELPDGRAVAAAHPLAEQHRRLRERDHVLQGRGGVRGPGELQGDGGPEEPRGQLAEGGGPHCLGLLGSAQGERSGRGPPSELRRRLRGRLGQRRLGRQLGRRGRLGRRRRRRRQRRRLQGQGQGQGRRWLRELRARRAVAAPHPLAERPRRLCGRHQLRQGRRGDGGRRQRPGAGAPEVPGGTLGEGGGPHGVGMLLPAKGARRRGGARH